MSEKGGGDRKPAKLARVKPVKDRNKQTLTSPDSIFSYRPE
jgi:hypothetical protein